jgi:hypothetical protein
MHDVVPWLNYTPTGQCSRGDLNSVTREDRCLSSSLYLRARARVPRLRRCVLDDHLRTPVATRNTIIGLVVSSSEGLRVIAGSCLHKGECEFCVDVENELYYFQWVGVDRGLARTTWACIGDGWSRETDRIGPTTGGEGESKKDITGPYLCCILERAIIPTMTFKMCLQ